MALEFHIKTHTLLHHLKSPFSMEENKSPTEEANFYLKYMNNPHLLEDLRRFSKLAFSSFLNTPPSIYSGFCNKGGQTAGKTQGKEIQP